MAEQARLLSTIPWDEVSHAARGTFNIWFGQPELEWAKKAWEILGHAKMTTYDSELERHRVLLRLLTLGAIYSDFCDAAWEECSSPLYGDWAAPLKLDPFVLGQLYARIPAENPEEDLGEALEKLVEMERGEVVEALVAGFGGVPQLYAALWNSRNSNYDELYDGEDDDDDTFVPEPAECAGYQWVEQGCLQYR